MKKGNQIITVIATSLVSVLIGGVSVYGWMKYQSISEELSQIRQQQQVLENIKKEKLGAVKEIEGDENDDEEDLLVQDAPGDTGENPPEESANWPEYESVEHDFHFQYPDKYKTVVDDYGWPYAVVHLIKKTGGQSYDVTFEVWDEDDAAESEGRTGQAVTYFSMVEHPQTGEFISITCWNSGIEQDCEDIYRTMSFQ